MTPNNHSTSFFLTLSSLIFFHFLILQTHSAPAPAPAPAPANATTPVSASTACQSTQYPGYCKNVLQSDNQTANVYEYGRFSIRKSISQAKKFVKLVNRYLTKSQKFKFTTSTIGALQDCQLFAQLNLDYLTTSFQSVNTTQNKTLSLTKAEDIQTFLSGILTNQQTCIDGLKTAQSSSPVQAGLNSPLLNDTKLYSVALSLFNKAWVPRKKKSQSHHSGGRNRSPFQDGNIPSVKVLQAQHRKRMLLNGDEDEGDDDQEVMISDLVTVSLDGSGNFTAVNDAIAAAPNNTDGSEGYFLIYVMSGVYEENVSIDKKKKYIMMIGDGINQTVITGNRSVVDNFTTFNSATFGKFLLFFKLLCCYYWSYDYCMDWIYYLHVLVFYLAVIIYDMFPFKVALCFSKEISNLSMVILKFSFIL